MIGFGSNTSIGSAKYIPYLYDRIKSIVLSFTNNSELLATRESVLIPTDADGTDPSFTSSENTFSVFYGGINQTSNWDISLFSQTNVTVTQVDNTFTVSSISADEAEYIIRATRDDFSNLTKTIKVYTTRKAAGWTDGSYDSGTGIITFTSDDGLGFVTNDLRPEDGLGWTSGNYNSGTGIVTFLSDDGLGFVTNDLRGGPQGDGWTGGSYNPTNGIVTFTSDDGLGFVTTDLRGATGLTGPAGVDGLGWTSGSYNPVNGIVTFTSDDGLGFVTDDLRADSGTIQDATSLAIRAADEGIVPGNTRGDDSVDFQTARSVAGNVASGNYSVIIGGYSNTASTNEGVVIGGDNNSVSGNAQRGFIGSGNNNSVTGAASVIVGGDDNSVNGYYASILGGVNNTINNPDGIYSVISGGRDNVADGNYSSICGGRYNIVNSYCETVIGAYSNNISGTSDNWIANEPIFRIGNGTGTSSRSDALRINKDGSTFAYGLKSGASQGAAGAAANELWIDTADNSIKIGV